MPRKLKDLLRAAGNLTPSMARDVLGLGGLAAITYGVALIYRPAGFIIGGVLAVTVAALLAFLDQKAGG